ncbi:MAG: cytochrome c [Acidimicrobiia bacterium]|nr:cytochrome c [Acidimicrobiia bacterium]
MPWQIGGREMRVWLVALTLVLAACGASASPDVTKVRDPASVEAGGALYQASCARCHGADADGGRVPGGPLAPSLVSKTGPSDQLLIEIVKRGRGLAMPSFATQLEEAEIASIIDFVRSLQVARLEE